MGQLIGLERSVIPACDVATQEKLSELVMGTATVTGIGGYKIGLELVIPFGLQAVVEIIRRHTTLPVIYDHQKAGNDIPEMGPKFAEAVRSSGASAAIIFPFTGMRTQQMWTEACVNAGLTVLVGGEMTHLGFLRGEGGYFTREDATVMYSRAVSMGIRDFVVPGNKPESAAYFRNVIQERLELYGKNKEEFRLYAPGFISQGGDITETGKVAGQRFHAIVGSALYKQVGVDAVRAAAQKLTAQIVAA